MAVTDPRLLFQWRDGTDQHDVMRDVDCPRLIGDPLADTAMLEGVTPVLLARHLRP